MSIIIDRKLKKMVLAFLLLCGILFIFGNIYGAIGPDDSDDCSYRANCYCGGSCGFPVYCCESGCDPCALCPGYCYQDEDGSSGNGDNEPPECECEHDWDCPVDYYCDGCYCEYEGPKCDDEYRCHYNKVEIYNTCYGWTGIVVEDCSKLDQTGTCGNWKCAGLGCGGKACKIKERVDTIGTCQNAVCITQSNVERCAEFICPYGCGIAPGGYGDCYPNAVILSDPAPSGGQIKIVEGESVNFNCSNSDDPEGTALTCNWNFGDRESDSGTAVTHTFDNEGSYTVTLTVTDEAGLTDSDSVIVNVTHANEPPIACFTVTPVEGIVGITKFTFDASCSSDSDGTITNYEWDFENDGTFDESGATKVTVKHIYTNKPVAGTIPFSVKLRVTDNGYNGQPPLSAEHTETVNVKNTKPVADFTAQPNEGIAPLSVDFDASYSSDPDGHNIVKYSWDFGDGASDDGTNVTITHTYSNGGTYAAKLTVEDEYGAVSDSKIVTINVYQPKAITVLNASDVLVGNATTIFVDCSDANDTVNLEILKQDESTGAFEPVGGGSFTVACGSITNYTPAEIGIYKVVASIAGCNTAECNRATHFQARQEVPELETPEISPVLALGIMLGVLALIRAKR